MSFGQAIAEARKKAGLSQKDLAARIKKDDGTPISPQYLNDIEHDRRNPPAGKLLEQLARELGLSPDYLSYLAGELPADVRTMPSPPDKVEAAFKAFRRALGKGTRQ
jgi:transcriptional regulator with XRE-family HTH domain